MEVQRALQFTRTTRVSRDEMKRTAAAAALDYVEPGMIVGVGRGSTAAFFITLLAERRDVLAAVASSEGDRGGPAGRRNTRRLAGRVWAPSRLRRRRRRGRPAAAAHQGRRRRAYAREGAGHGRAAVRLHRRRVQARRAPGRCPHPARGAADGRAAGRRARGRAGRPGRAAAQLCERQRQRDLRRRRASIWPTRSGSRWSSTPSPESSSAVSSRAGAPTWCSWARPAACASRRGES